MFAGGLTVPSADRPTWCGSLPPEGASPMPIMVPKEGLPRVASTTNTVSLQAVGLWAPAQTKSTC